MKALILAAGVGSRLAPITDRCPKCMVPVGGKPIIFKQIENLRLNGISDITIIAGYKADILEQAVKSSFTGINIIYNKDYAQTNNMFSAYMGHEAIQKNNFLMMNADVFFDASIIQNLYELEEDNAIVVDIGNYMIESMKVVERKGRITEISKNILPEHALGSSIDVYKFSSSAGEKFFEKCKDYIEFKGERNLWSEVALDDILSDVKFMVCPMVGRWYEIDNHEDLEIANRIFG